MAFFNRTPLFVAFILGLLLMAYNAEAWRLCTYRSKTSRGACKSNRLCTSVCHREQFTGGYCSRKYSAADGVGDGDGLIVDGSDVDEHDDVLWLKARRCVCTKKCNGSKKPPPGGDEPALPGEEAPLPRRNNGPLGLTN